MAGKDDLSSIRDERDLWCALLELGHHEDPRSLLRSALALLAARCGAKEAYLEVRSPTGAASALWSRAHDYTEDEVRLMRQLVAHTSIAGALAAGRSVQRGCTCEVLGRGAEHLEAHGCRAVMCASIGAHPSHGVVLVQGGDEGEPLRDDGRRIIELFARHVAVHASALLEREADVEVCQEWNDGRVIGRSAALQTVMRKANVAAQVNSPLLIIGPIGTGKTMLARVIHDRGSRRTGPFVKVNCGAIPESLVEAELFGVVRGAHSTATEDVAGKFCVAQSGTLLLDEISEFSYDAQGSLSSL